MYEEMKKRKEEREKRKLEKMRTLGADYMLQERKRKLKKRLRKRKAEKVQASDDENDLDYKVSSQKFLLQQFLIVFLHNNYYFFSFARNLIALRLFD